MLDKNDVKRLRGLFTIAAGSIGAVKGEIKTPDNMNITRMQCLVGHWQESGREILEILEKELQPNLFLDEQSLTLDLEHAITLNGQEDSHGATE